jgi:hypothetical protein
MSLSNHYRRIVYVCAAALLVSAWLASCSSTPTVSKNPPKITQFAAAPGDIGPNDSTLITYTVTGADSVVLTPPRQKLAGAQTGSIWVKPPRPTRYVLLAYNNDGRDSSVAAVTMNSAIPLFVSAGLSPDTLLIHDSTMLSWNVVRADSIIVNRGVGKLPGNTSGNLWIKPDSNTTYTAIAFNQYGEDTSTFKVAVQVPYRIMARSGSYYKGNIGANSLTPALQFSVLTPTNSTATKAWMHFRVVEGDGVLSLGPNDSVRVDQSLYATLLYNFIGVLGHAIIRGVVTGVDSTEVYLRASTLIPGAGGQGQYVLFKDAYLTVKSFNGPPASVDVDPNFCQNYANYEAALGVVFVIADTNCNSRAEDNEPVSGVIVNTVYAGKTKEGIGVHSTLGNVRAAYGAPDSLKADPTPDTVVVKYLSKGLTFYCGTSGDSIVAEIHLDDVGVGAAFAGKARPTAPALTPNDAVGYHRWRR